MPIKFSKLVLLFSVVAIAVVIGAAFLLNQSSQPQPPNPSPQAGDRALLSIESLKNMEYYDPECDVQIKLQDGVFKQESYLCKGEILPGFLLRIYNDIALGDLTHDGKDEAAVILSTNYGGSGDFRKLVIIENQGGDEVQIATQNLGDRVIINAISIQNSRIILRMLVHASQDPACCPTVEEFVEYELINRNELRRI